MPSYGRVLPSDYAWDPLRLSAASLPAVAIAVATRMLISGPMSGPNDSSLAFVYRVLSMMGATTFRSSVLLASSICNASSALASVILFVAYQSHGSDLQRQETTSAPSIEYGR